MAKERQKISYRPLDGILVRAPLLPVEAYWSEDTAPESRGRWIETAMAVGSLALSNAAGKSAAEAARFRYRTRMATRPTPFGLFAGVGLAQWGTQTTLSIGDNDPDTHTRPEMGWLLRLAISLEARPEIRRSVRVFANTAAFIRGGRILLEERSSQDGDGKTPPRVSVRATPAARLVLQLARAPVAYAALFQTVAEAAPNVAPERIEKLLDELIGQSLLLTELRPPLTVADPARWLIDRLATVSEAEDIRGKLEAFCRSAKRWDKAPVERRISSYADLSEKAADLGAKPDEPPVQVDTTFAFSGNAIQRDIGREVARAASLMLRLSPFPAGFPYLANYRQAFVARYGEGREVPLMEMLDPNWGLGPPDRNSHGGWLDFDRRDQTLLELACNALRDRKLVVTLDDELIDRLDTQQPDPAGLPASLDISTFVCADPGGLETGDYLVVVGPNIGAPWAGRNLGRFADMLGKRGRAAVSDAAQASHALPGAIAAELNYLPRTFHYANVAVRPNPRDHEISLGLSSSVSPDKQIPLDALLVGVTGNRFYLKWPGHADRVAVSSSHMLNYLEAPPVCHFLAHMLADDITQLHVFDWGPAAEFPFLPRVQVGKCVLRLAEWRLRGEDAALANSKAFRAFVTEKRAEWQIPRMVYLSQGDVRLLLDLDDERYLEQMRREMKKLGSAMRLQLHEALPGPEHAWLPGPGGHYIAELVVSLTKTAAADSEKPTADTQAAAPDDLEIERIIPPGGTWLYFKLFGSPDAEEELLTGPLRTFLEENKSAGLCRDFFFLRYSDPDAHLRLRLRLVDPDDAAQMAGAFFALGGALIESDLSTRIAVDTYERETERYGGPAAIEAAEDVFAADSALALSLFPLLKDGQWKRETVLAVSAIDLLDGLSLGEDVERDIAEQLRPIRRETTELFRSQQADLWSLLENPDLLAEAPNGPEVLDRLARRREATRLLGVTLNDLRKQDRLTNPAVEICQSLVHMHCNRTIGRDRSEERKVLGLMARLLHSRRVRA
jgi:thiopeptide-type bacteriocin biosynthesis protein